MGQSLELETEEALVVSVANSDTRHRLMIALACPTKGSGATSGVKKVRSDQNLSRANCRKMTAKIRPSNFKQKFMEEVASWYRPNYHPGHIRGGVIGISAGKWVRDGGRHEYWNPKPGMALMSNTRVVTDHVLSVTNINTSLLQIILSSSFSVHAK